MERRPILASWEPFLGRVEEDRRKRITVGPFGPYRTGRACLTCTLPFLFRNSGTRFLANERKKKDDTGHVPSVPRSSGTQGKGSPSIKLAETDRFKQRVTPL